MRNALNSLFYKEKFTCRYPLPDSSERVVNLEEITNFYA